MVTQVSLSHIEALGYTAAQFAQAVEEYRQARVAHAETIGEPAPIAKIPGVEQCVRRLQPDAENPEERFETDYQFIDDRPPPPAPPTLQDKKNKRVVEVQKLAIVSVEANIPALRRRLWESMWRELSTKPEDERNDDEKLFFKQHGERMKQEGRIERHLGQLESQIHDLTEDTVDAWKPEPFPS